MRNAALSVLFTSANSRRVSIWFKQTAVDYVCIYVQVLELLSELNYASNFFVYVLSAGQFRHVIRQLFRRRPSSLRPTIQSFGLTNRMSSTKQHTSSVNNRRLAPADRNWPLHSVPLFTPLDAELIYRAPSTE